MTTPELVDSWWKASSEINDFWKLLLVLHSGGLGWFAEHLRGTKQWRYCAAFAVLSLVVHGAIAAALWSLYDIQSSLHRLIPATDASVGRALTSAGEGGRLIGYLAVSWLLGVALASAAVMKLPPKSP